jgi:hypothetical protein
MPNLPRPAANVPVRRGDRPRRERRRNACPRARQTAGVAENRTRCSTLAPPRKRWRKGRSAWPKAQFDANRSGVSSNRFGVLWRLAQHVPGVSEARTLRRRTKADGSGRLITLEQLHHAYAKAQIEPQYWPALDALVREILSPGELAAAIHRGLVPDPGLLAGRAAGTAVQRSTPIRSTRSDAVQEAMGSGYDRDRLGVLVGLQGLPMGTHEAAQAFFRGIITHGDYIRAFNESNSRNEWARRCSSRRGRSRPRATSWRTRFAATMISIGRRSRPSGTG